MGFKHFICHSQIPGNGLYINSVKLFLALSIYKLVVCNTACDFQLQMAKAKWNPADFRLNINTFGPTWFAHMVARPA